MQPDKYFPFVSSSEVLFSVWGEKKKQQQANNNNKTTTNQQRNN